MIFLQAFHFQFPFLQGLDGRQGGLGRGQGGGIGNLVFQGGPAENTDCSALEQPGTYELPLRFRLPEGAQPGVYQVRLGLWVPERIGRPDERMIPDDGDQDRRVTVGELVVREDGQLDFVKR